MRRENARLEELREILHKTFKADRERIEVETRLYDGDLELSSIQLLELTMAVEDYYGGELDPDDLTEDNFATVGSLLELIQKSLLN